MNARGNACAVLVAALLFCQFGCGGGKSVGDTAVGTYMLDRSTKLAALSPVERETLLLRRDRIFSQEIVLRGGESFRATGNWRAERIAEKSVGEGVRVVNAVWVTLDGFMEMAGENVIRVTNSFHEVHQVGMDALFSYEGTNSLYFFR
jgi:hypothetical protein